jgi:hypothetical protein
MAIWTGWLALVAIVLAALVPIVTRLRTGRGLAPTSRPIRAHVVLGLTTSAFGFAHTLTVIPALGSPAATGGGMLALLPGGVAFFVLLAHTGIGLQLRDPKLRDRAKKRSTHRATAVTIALAVAVHVAALELSAR